MATVIETIELTKNYGKHQAVRGVNLSVQAGSVCAFLGQNGAGKSSIGAAVAAFGYGTETIRRVDKIAGPGNAWVTAAKKLVVGDVGIDGLAGPSEVVIVADPDSDAAEVAADLLAQAEHDPQAVAVLITTDAKLAKRVSAEIDRQLEDLATAETARAALDSFGVALVVAGLEEALDLVERIAPEHLTRRRRHVRPAGGASLWVDGRRLLAFCSNDYLGLSRHPAAGKRQGASRPAGCNENETLRKHDISTGP